MPYGPWSPWIDVRCVAVSPHDPKTVYAGSHVGLHRSTDRGAKFEFIKTPFDNKQIWSIAVHPNDSRTLYVGIAPFNSDYPLWRSKDGGETWGTVGLKIDPFNKVNGAIHVTTIAFDPNNADTIYAAIEIGGVWRSTDGGDHFNQLGPLGSSVLDDDIHSVTVTPAGTIFVTSPLGIYRSKDLGSSFTLHKFPAYDDPDPMATRYGVTGYSRGVIYKLDKPATIYVGVGDSTPGTHGNVMVSDNDGDFWSACKLSAEPNSHIYHVVSHSANPNRLLAASMNGYLYCSEDGGRTFTKFKREFGEIRGLAWLPN
jgi:photosystem II stability/assembly factor-like uncharacterized protein